MSWLETHSIFIVGFALAIVATIHMLSQQRNPQSTVAWLIAIFAFPWLGVPLYLMLGGRKMRRLMDSKADLHLTDDAREPSEQNRVEAVLRSLGIPAASDGNAVNIHATTSDATRELVCLIESAVDSIWYSTFIFAEDEIGREVLKSLTRKAADGVDVRLLLDGVGSLRTSKRFLKPLIDAGGEVAWFMPVIHRPLRGRSNLRNHRKLIVVDGSRAWSGGRNTCVDSLSESNADKVWIDLSYNLCGPSVAVLMDVFHSDWSFATGCELPADDRLECVSVGKQRVQPIPSGPDVRCDALLNAFLAAMYESDERIWIVTPYLVPPKSVTDVLCLGARRGVDVQIIVPQRSNHRLADWARGPHLRAIQDAGGRVLCHPKMVHAKTALFDDTVAMIGSANLDERSLLLNYELMLAMYSLQEIQSTQRWIERITTECQPWHAPTGRTRQIVESLAATLSPLL